MICFVPSNPNFIVFVHFFFVHFFFVHQKNNLYHLVHFASLGCETHDCDCRMLHPGLSDNHGCDSSFQVFSLFFLLLFVEVHEHGCGSNAFYFHKPVSEQKLEPACRNVLFDSVAGLPQIG